MSLHRFQAHQDHSLSRTGDSPLQFNGALLWRGGHDDRVSIRVFRCDQPHRLWIAAVELHTPCGLLSHVNTAAQLLMLIDDLRSVSPTALARAHGMVPAAAKLVAPEEWRRLVADLSRAAAQLEASAIRHAPG